MKRFAKHIIPLSLSALLCGAVSASETSFSGKISFTGNPPPAALIYVPGKALKAPEPEIDQVDKQFTKSIVVGAPGSTVLFKNSDQVEHNVFANDSKHKAKFDVGLMQTGGKKAISVDWEADAMIRVGCKIHPRMRAYIATVDARFHQVIEFNAEQKVFPINLKNIPAGSKKLVINIPKYDEIILELGNENQWSAAITKKGKKRGEITIAKGNH
ncbi:hypothetical protein [Zhongshania sp.]|uniref:hypothetical protein n=1 Tax=Zhongshania sp. TaxID=1971902 RepID=UPI00356152A4